MGMAAKVVVGALRWSGCNVAVNFVDATNVRMKLLGEWSWLGRNGAEESQSVRPLTCLRVFQFQRLLSSVSKTELLGVLCCVMMVKPCC
jgi:hypothetical protein